MNKTISYKYVAHVSLIIFVLLSLLPFYLSIVTSLQPMDWQEGLIPDLWPDSFNISNYWTAWEKGNFGRALFNSLLIGFSVAFLHLFAAAMCGYAFAKKSFPGKNVIFTVLFLTVMIPPRITIVPSFLMMNYFGWLNSFLPLIIPRIGDALGIFLLKQFMETIPDSLIEAARIEGCSELGIFLKIILPIAKPALATLAILTFQTSYNDFFWPYIYINEARLNTVQLALKAFDQFYNIGSRDLVINNAANILISLPLIIFFVIFSKQFVGNISLSGLKG